MEDERLCLDRINNLPSPIIENILCLLPIKNAVSTSVLSRNWRYNWVKIPKFEFSEEDFVTTNDDLSRKQMRFKIFYAIYQMLLVHRGPIHEFRLSMDADETCFEIVQIILHLSRNYTLKKFSLDLGTHCGYWVPLSIFSLHQLTDLYLRNCTFIHDPTKFNGFRSLTSLRLERVVINTETLLHLISTCPLLKSLSLILSDEHLSDSGSTILDLFRCLHVVEHLTVCHYVIWTLLSLGYDEVPRELPISLVHLKSFCLDGMSFLDKYGLPFIALLIRCSPNLEKLKLQVWHTIGCFDIDSITLQGYSGIWLEHLKELEIEYFNNFKPEMEFVKLILTKSPVLKKVRILLDRKVDKDEELKMLSILLHSPRASPVVDIVVKRPVK